MNDNTDIAGKALHDEELIDSYLRGKMTTEEEGVFMAGLKADRELRERAVLTARMAKAMKDVGREEDARVVEALYSTSEDAVREIAGRTQADAGKPQADAGKPQANAVAMPVRPHGLRLWIIASLSIAASVALLVVCGYQYYDYRVTTGLGEEYSAVFTESPYLRGTTDDAVTRELHVLFACVRDGKDLGTAIPRLEAAWGRAKSQTYNAYTNHAPQIGWSLAIAYLKDNRRREARQTLEELAGITEEGSFIRDKAVELLKRL